MNDPFSKSAGQRRTEELFASAVNLHQQGRLREAETGYRDVLAFDPRHAGALHYFGLLFLQAGQADTAADLIRRSLVQHDRNAEAHYHLGLALAQLGQFPDVVTHNRRAVELQPQYVEAYLNLGNGLKALGRSNDAQAAYERVIALAPQSPQGHFNLANTLIDRGRTDEAIAAFERTLALRPDYPEALNNLAGALLTRGRADDAQQRYRQALALRPDFSEAMAGLALALLMRDDAFAAMVLLCKALAIQPTTAAKDLFVSCAQRLSVCPDIPELRGVLTAALSEPWSRPRLFARFAATVLKNQGPAAGVLTRMQRGEPLSPETLRALGTDSLLTALLENVPVADLSLEALLTAARRSVLALCAQTLPQPDIDALLPFVCSLSRQCFINEYVFALDPAEESDLARERDRLAAICASDGDAPPLLIAAVACYHPLHRLAGHDRLAARSWEPALDGVITQQIREPATERRLAAALPQLTAIDDATSRAVQQQYEENPFPRWVKTIPAGRPVSFDTFLQEMLPSAHLEPIGAARPDLLVAGCGTGQQPVEIATRVSPLRILAVDLSSASLGYAARKTGELGITNIEYGQADILRLGELGRRFDVIQASGVLHHMAEPFTAWRRLLDLLRPGGLMLLGFYSTHARTQVAAGRAFIAEHGFTSDPAGIRRARAAIAALPADAPVRMNTAASDFFSMSECRDFLFHVSEQTLTLPQIAQFIREAGLEFLGFQLSRHTAGQYAADNPHDPAMTDLGRWDAFEQKHPLTFLGMYQFWVRSSPVGG